MYQVGLLSVDRVQGFEKGVGTISGVPDPPAGFLEKIGAGVVHELGAGVASEITGGDINGRLGEDGGGAWIVGVNFKEHGVPPLPELDGLRSASAATEG
jgi:hypothetical protein